MSGSVKVKVLGLPRSGTNYLRWLLDHNFTAQLHKHLGWEHSLPTDRWQGYMAPSDETVLELTAGLTRLVIRKDRRHWLDSIDRHPGARNMLAEKAGVYPERYYDEWHAAWTPYAHTLRYESFLQDFEASMRYLGTLLGQEPVKFTQPARVPESPDWRAADRRRYL